MIGNPAMGATESPSFRRRLSGASESFTAESGLSSVWIKLFETSEPDWNVKIITTSSTNTIATTDTQINARGAPELGGDSEKTSEFHRMLLRPASSCNGMDF